VWHSATAEEAYANAEDVGTVEEIANGILQAEIVAEFDPLDGGHGYHWTHLEEAIYQYQLRASATPKWRPRQGPRYWREYRARRSVLLSSTIVAVRWCIVCKTPFAVTALNESRGRGVVCSKACRGLSRRNIKRVRIGKSEKTLSDWARQSGIKFTTLWRRINVEGLSPADALAVPVAKKDRRPVTIGGETKPLAQWAREKGLPSHCVRARVKNLGWSVERALATPLTGREEGGK
jgi:hypothetical protein